MRMTLLAGIAGALVTTGCATVPPDEDRLVGYNACDAEFIAKVEREAKRRHAAVSWMRCPQVSPARRFPPVHHGERRDT